MIKKTLNSICAMCKKINDKHVLKSKNHKDYDNDYMNSRMLVYSMILGMIQGLVLMIVNDWQFARDVRIISSDSDTMVSNYLIGELNSKHRTEFLITIILYTICSYLLMWIYDKWKDYHSKKCGCECCDEDEGDGDSNE